MKELQQHERFEMEVLQRLSNAGVLNRLIFGGGTCLRLCFGLPRYSVDLDFWKKPDFTKRHFEKIKSVLARDYRVTDAHAKHFTYLLEIQSSEYPRKLKIEIRKTPPSALETERNIAFSPFSTLQVQMTTMTLRQMGENKVRALLERREIRDAYDLEFIAKKGQANVREINSKDREALIAAIDSFKTKDFKVKLGSLLPAEERNHYSQKGFQILKNALL